MMERCNHPADRRRTGMTLAGATGAVGTGAALFNYSAGYFVKPLEAALGWSRTEIALGATLMMSVAALMMPIMGALVDRYTTRVLAPVAFIAYGMACFALAAIPPILPLYYLVILLLAVPWTGTTANVFASLVAANFVRRRGVALGVMMSGTALLMIMFAPLLQHVIDVAGWRAGYALLGGVALLFGIPCAMLADRTSFAPAGIAATGPGSPSLMHAVRTSSYWKLLIASALATTAIGGFLNQIPALVSDKGLDAIQVGLVGSTFAASIIAGRIVVGYLLDILRPSWVAMGAMFTASAGAMLFLVPEASIAMFAVGACLVGFAMGAEGDLQAFFTAHLFGLRAFAGIFGTLGTVSVIGMGGGALLFGNIHDRTGNYDAALIIAAGLYTLSGVLFASLGYRESGEGNAIIDGAPETG